MQGAPQTCGRERRNQCKRWIVLGAAYILVAGVSRASTVTFASGSEAHALVQEFGHHVGAVWPDERLSLRMHAKLPERVVQRFEHRPVHRVQVQYTMLVVMWFPGNVRKERE